jgi:HK97 family phage portal protein
MFGREKRTLSRDTIPAALFPTAPGTPCITPTNALTVADAWACIRVLSDAAGSLPLHCYRRTKAGRTQISSRTSQLLDNPAPSHTTANLVGQMAAHLNLFGNAYLGKYRDNTGRIHQLGLLDPNRIQVEIRGGLPFFNYTNNDGRQATLTSSDVVHIKALSVDGVVGLSPVQQCRAAIGLSQTLTNRAERFFANDARPGGALRFAERMDRQKARDVVAIWRETHGGTDNSGLPAVLTGGAEWVSIEMPADDAQFLQQRKLSATEVCRIFRVPPHMLGAESGDTMTYKNVESASLQFVTYSLRPWLVTIEQALSADVDLFAQNHYCQFQLDALLRADAATRADVYTKALDPITGWMTREEVRELEDLQPESASSPRATQPTRGGRSDNGRSARPVGRSN